MLFYIMHLFVQWIITISFERQSPRPERKDIVPEKDKQDSKNRKATRSTRIVGAAVMVSRVFGLIREKVIAYYFSAGIAGDAFYAAFRIPNLFRDLFAEGALSKAFVTTFMDTDHKDGEEAAWRLANIIFTLTALFLTGFTIIGIVITPVIVDWMFAGKGFELSLDPSEWYGFTSKRELTIFLARIMFPFLLLVSLAAIAMGLLNSRGRFGIPALSSAFFNIGSLALGVIGYYIAPGFDLPPVTGMAVGVLFGGFLQFAVQIPSMRAIGFRFRPDFHFRDARVRQVLRLMLPALLGVAAIQINVFVNSIFASQGEGWLTWINRAFRLVHLPIGVFGVAISTVALPNLARLIAENDLDGYRAAFSHAMRLMFFLTIPATIGLILLAEPICGLLFEGGKATSFDTRQIAAALQWYALGLVGYSAMKIITDGFYAFQDTRTPVLVSLLTVSINIVLNYVFIFHFHFDHRSLALATTCTVTLNAVILLILLRRRAVRLNFSAAGRLLLRIIPAAAALALAILGTRHGLRLLFDEPGMLRYLLHVLVPVLAGGSVYFVICKLFKIKELDELLQRGS